MEDEERFLVASDPPIFARVKSDAAQFDFGGSVGLCIAGNRYHWPGTIEVEREWFVKDKLLPVDWTHWKVVEQDFDDGVNMEEIAHRFVRDKVLDRQSEFLQTDAFRLRSCLKEALRLAEMNSDGSVRDPGHGLRKKLRRMIHLLEGGAR